MRNLARAMFDAAVAAADPAAATTRALAAQPLAEAPGQTLILAIGKAAIPMVEAALAQVPRARAIAVTNPENAHDLPGVELHITSHPEPSAAGEAAAAAVEAALAPLGEGDQVLALISGGGSALLPAPRPPVTLEDKIAVNKLLLSHGFDILETNLVRQQLSRLKGGGLTRAAAPAMVRALILSDVVGDDLRAIASGPTSQPLGTPAEAAALLRRKDLWDALPPRVQTHLSSAEPLPPPPQADNELIGANRISLEAAAKAAQAAGLTATIVTDQLTGDVSDAAAQILTKAKGAPPGVLIFGGETTVTLKGTGKGGRNQELALHIAKTATLPGDWLFLSAGTDGRDGPTEAAGGFADAGTWSRIGPEAQCLLDNNDSNAALARAGDLLTTGGTGTNVADVQFLFLT